MWSYKNENRNRKDFTRSKSSINKNLLDNDVYNEENNDEQYDGKEATLLQKFINLSTVYFEKNIFKVRVC